MPANMALNLVSKVMNWDETAEPREYRWLKLMSDAKFDGYADYRAGIRFSENLAAWLKQFDPEDRDVAYRFVRNRLIYISPAEMQQLIEAFVPEIVTRQIRERAAKELGVEPYEVWCNAESDLKFQQMLRRTLFVGMSDGSRIDVLRRANIDRLTTEQIVPSMSIDHAKWVSLGGKLAKDKLGGGPLTKFDHVYLIDDFTASGTTFIRETDDGWDGKLYKFNKAIANARNLFQPGEFPLAENFTLHIHHYLSSEQAGSALRERVKKAEKLPDKQFGKAYVTEGLLLPPDTKMSDVTDSEMLRLCDKYYDHQLFVQLQKHCEEAGQSHMRYGYADCALPIILDHNTPNNSLSILWADTQNNTNGAHPMRPLFYRRNRHG